MDIDWDNQDKFKCIICMNFFTKPVIASDGKVYCEECIIQWTSNNSFSPFNGQKVTNWIECSLFNDLYLVSCIYSDLNLVKLVDNHTFHCYNTNDAYKILKMIDAENIRRLNEDDKNIIVMKNVFSNNRLIKQILSFINDAWSGNTGWTIVHYICRFGDIELIRHMLTHYNINLNIKTSHYRWYPIQFICGDGNTLYSTDQLNAIELLIDHKADLNINAQDTPIPIHLVCSDENNLNSHDQVSAIKLLIEHKVDLEVSEFEKWRPIHFVCSDSNNLESQDQLAAIKLLIEHKVDLEVSESENWRPMHFVCSDSNKLKSYDQLFAIKLLIDNKVDLEVSEIESWRPIHFICSDSNNLESHDQLAAIKLLIDNKVNLEVSDIDKFRPIHYVCSEQNNLDSTSQFTAIKLMIEQKINLDVTNDNDWKPIHYVCSDLNKLNSTDKLCTIKLLSKQKINLDAENDEDMRPIHFLCSSNVLVLADQLEAIKILIEHEVDLSAKAKCGKTPCQMIIDEKNKLSPENKLKIIQLIMDNIKV